MTSLDQVLTPSQTAEHAFNFEIPEGWGQGKAVFGGLILGGIVRALTAVLGQPERRLRSLSAELLGSPVAGPATIQTRLLRAGNAVTSYTAELHQNGQMLTHAAGVFGSARPVDSHWSSVPAPDAPPWQDIAPLPKDVPFAPEFTQHFEYRPIRGFPFSGNPASDTLGFIRPAGGTANKDAAYVTTLVDAWWLAVMVGLEAPRPAATLAFSLDLYQDVDQTDDAPLLHRGTTSILRDGYASETRELWTHDGRPVSLNRQMVCVIR